MSNPRNTISMTTQNDHQQMYTQPTISTQTVTQPYPYPPQPHNNGVYNNQPPYPPQPQNNTMVYGNQTHQQQVPGTGTQLRTTHGQVSNSHATMFGSGYHQHGHEHDNHHKNSKKSLKHQVEDVIHNVFKKR